MIKLSDATNLLESHGRDFSEIYKLYNFKDETDVKEYLDFIIHEPVEWMKGFPARWVTKGSFGRPKTALVKLLKMDKVRDEYTESYIQRVYDCVWSTFKKHADDILSHRMQKNTIVPDNSGTVDKSSRESIVDTDIGCDDDLTIQNANDNESVHSVKIRSRLTVETWQIRYKILEEAYRALLINFGDKGLVASTSILLDALSGVKSV